MVVTIRDDNGAGFFGDLSRLVPNGMEFYFNKRVWDEFEIFFLKLRIGLGIAPSCSAPIIYKINF